MCISKSVGEGGDNDKLDVRSLQLLLNLNSASGASAIIADGLWGPGSRKALGNFQQLNGIAPSNKVTPNDTTLSALRAGLPAPWASAKLHAVLISAQSTTVDKFCKPILAVFEHYQINTPLRQAHFLAQIAHESGCLLYTEELASGEAYELKANLGNTQKGDGKLFKGRGLIQLTGRANYRDYGKACGRDFEGKDAPSLVSSNAYLAVDVAGWFWNSRKLNRYADLDDVQSVTRIINGGTNGFDERKAYLARAKWLLGL